MTDTFVELVGILASVLIVISMTFKTTTFKGTIIMRVINLLGSIVFICYGTFNNFTEGGRILWSTVLANVATLIINAIYIYKEIKEHKRAIV